jgi:hypothetical protein
VLQRKSPKRVALSNIDRLLLVGLYCLAPAVLDAVKIIRLETLIRWHRAGFRAFWRWKSRPRGGRPRTPADIRRLIREMSIANPLWGAPRIHGELLKLGIDVGQTTVAKYMAKRRRPPSQSGCAWRVASSLPSEIVSKILQRGAHAPVLAKGRADPPCGPDRRSDVGRANLGRPAPPIYPSVSFRQGHRGCFQNAALAWRLAGRVLGLPRGSSKCLARSDKSGGRPLVLLGFLRRSLAKSRAPINSKVFELCTRFQLFSQSSLFLQHRREAPYLSATNCWLSGPASVATMPA